MSGRPEYESHPNHSGQQLESKARSFWGPINVETNTRGFDIDPASPRLPVLIFGPARSLGPERKTSPRHFDRCSKDASIGLNVLSGSLLVTYSTYCRFLMTNARALQTDEPLEPLRGLAGVWPALADVSPYRQVWLTGISALGRTPVIAFFAAEPLISCTCGINALAGGLHRLPLFTTGGESELRAASCQEGP